MKIKHIHIYIPAILSVSLLFPISTLAEEPALPQENKTEQDSIVALPFWGDIRRLRNTGSARSLTSDDLKYPAIDFRNMLTGLITGL